MRLSPKDKRVINDFIDRKSIGSHSRRLVTDGHTLDIYGLGGRGVAEWRELGGGEGWKIIFRDLGRKDQEVIQRYIRKTVSPRWLESFEPYRSKRRVERDPAYGGTSPAYSGTSRSKSPRSDVLITRKKYKRTNGVKVKKTKYKVKSRDSAGPVAPAARLVPRNAGCPVGTQVQSVILSQQFFNQREAASWIRRNGFRLSKIDESANFWRFRQQPPSQFEEGTFRTIRLRPGVEAVIGCPR